MDDETFQALRQADWGKIGKTLLAVAINYSNKYYSIGYKDCDDIVQDVIDKTIRGKPVLDPESGEDLPWRTWDPKKGELLPWLCWCVKSEIDNSSKKSATKSELLLFNDDADRAFEESFLPHSADTKISENLINPESALLLREKEVHNKQKIGDIYELVEGDEELEEVVLAIDCLIDESETAQKPARLELAEYLEISVNEVNNRMKRLRRRLFKNKG